jgi:hypothetical protein
VRGADASGRGHLLVQLRVTGSAASMSPVRSEMSGRSISDAMCRRVPLENGVVLVARQSDAISDAAFFAIIWNSGNTAERNVS